MSVFFVFSSLPYLELASKPDISSAELYHLFEMNFTKKQMKDVHTLRLWIDLQNIYNSRELPPLAHLGSLGPSEPSYLLNSGKVLAARDSQENPSPFQERVLQGIFDERGNYSKNTLKDLLMHGEELPDYVFDFFSMFDNLQAQKKHFTWLLSAYFKNERMRNKGYLREFLDFEHQLRIVLTGYRSKLLKREIAKELQYEDLNDPIVAMTVTQKDTSSNYVFPFEYKDLEAVLADAGPDPTRKYEAIAAYRFNFYSKNVSESPFTLKGCLAYMMCLWILEEYFTLKKEKGETMLDQLLEKDNVS